MTFVGDTLDTGVCHTTDDGGPLELWRELAANLTGRPVDGGHFIPEEHPQDAAEALAAFFSPGAAEHQSPPRPDRQRRDCQSRKAGATFGFEFAKLRCLVLGLLSGSGATAARSVTRPPAPSA